MHTATHVKLHGRNGAQTLKAPLTDFEQYYFMPPRPPPPESVRVSVCAQAQHGDSLRIPWQRARMKSFLPGLLRS